MLLLAAAILPLSRDAAPRAPTLREAGIRQIVVPASRAAAWQGTEGITVETADLVAAVKGGALGGLSRERGDRQPVALDPFERLAIFASSASAFRLRRKRAGRRRWRPPRPLLRSGRSDPWRRGGTGAVGADARFLGKIGGDRISGGRHRVPDDGPTMQAKS